MSYIGNQPYQVAFVTDTFSGNGSTTAFTMSVAPANTSSVLVVVSGVVQDPSTYSVSGTTLTFTAAPPSGTGNISCRYLGIPASGVTTTAYRTVTQFTATAGQTTFTPPSYTVGFINVYRNGVLLGTADYTATNGTTVVLASAATSGDLVTVESFLVSSVLNAIPSTGGSISNLYLDTGNQNGTGSMIVPVGTTAQRPGATTAGQLRLNSSYAVLEYHNGTVWTELYPANYSIDFLVVAGGASGGDCSYASGSGGGPGGGGAGGYIASTATLTGGASYSITIGAGGAAVGVGTSNSYIAGNSGSNSVAFGSTAIGGGYGNTGNGGSGGSGGGGGYAGSGGSGTSGQGTSGGNGTNASPYPGGGGGGAGSGGGSGSGSTPGNGGAGLNWQSLGTYYAGGGGASTWNGTVSTGGTGGGGAGGPTGTAGTANTGGGGGAGGYGPGGSGAGGSGIVILRYLGNPRGTGGTITQSGGYTYHTFTTSGTYTA